MSVTIFKDVEEALAREVRRITTHNNRTQDKVILRETYDPLSGEIVTSSIEPEFYDSSADASGGEYPHFFIKLLKSREDKTIEGFSDFFENGTIEYDLEDSDYKYFINNYYYAKFINNSIVYNNSLLPKEI